MAHSASSHRALFVQSNQLILKLASSVALTMLLIGCDNSTGKSDKEVSVKLEDARAKNSAVAGGGTMSNPDLDAASRETGDSLPVQIDAKIAFADSELQLAQGLASKTLTNNVMIDRLIREVVLLSEQIQSNNELVEALQKFDPSRAPSGGQSKAVLVSLKDTQALVTGSDEKPDWVRTDATTLAALNPTDKKLASLQTEVARLNDSIKSESDQRNQLLDSADKLIQQSQHEQGDKSVDLFKQGSDARKQAADLTVKIDADSASLARATADLGVQQGQHDSMTSTVKSLDIRSESIRQDWKAVQERIAALNQQSKALLGENPVTAPMADPKKNGDLVTSQTIGSKAAAINALGEENKRLGAEAADHFNKAIELYGTAAGLAVQVSADLAKKSGAADPNKPEQAAWSAQAKALDNNHYLFLQADAFFQRANFLARSASASKSRLDMITRVKPVVIAAGLQPLSTLDDTNPDLAKQKSDAVGTSETGAAGSFAKAAEILERVSSSTAPQELRNAAKTEEIFAQHGWATLEAIAGDIQESARHQKLASDQVAAATAQQLTLPALPPDLVVPVK